MTYFAKSILPLSQLCKELRISYVSPKTNVRKCSTNVSVFPKQNMRVFLKKRKSPDSTGYWFLLAIPVTAFGLGTWQIKRKIWKEGLIKQLQEACNNEPVDFPNDLNDLLKMEYHPVKVKGRFDHTREFLMGPRTLVKNENSESSTLFSSSTAGYWVITPFKLSDRDITILVNRGWVPSKQKSPSSRMNAQVTDEVEITGVIRLSEKRQPLGMKNIPEKGIWMYRDLEKMAEIAGTQPVLLDANASSTLPNGPIGGQTVVNLHNYHLTYIFTWYGLCAATSYLWYKRYVRLRV